MILDEILGNIRDKKTQKEVIKIKFEWFELEKKRVSKIAEDGVSVGVCINEVLSEGDIIGETENSVYICEVNPTEVIKIYVKSMKDMGKLCFEIGNRHLPLKIEDEFVSVPYDHPTYEYLLKLGFNAVCTFEKFVSFTECKAHAPLNSHSHDHKH